MCIRDSDKTSIIGSNDYKLLAILNSRLIDYFIHSIASTKANGYYEYKPMYISQIPISLELKNLAIEEMVKLIVNNKKEKKVIVNKLVRQLTRKFKIEKIPRNLQNWHILTFDEFTKELKKKKIKLGLSEEAEWEDYFEAEKAKAQTIQSEIDKTDREIDKMVYELYGLTEEEIKIVEGN